MKTTFQIVLIALALFATGCSTTNTVPTKLNRAINVREEITPLGKDKYRIKLYGLGLFNRAGAIETFHIESEKLFSGQPYSYFYKVDKELLVANRPDNGNTDHLIMLSYQFGAVPVATLALLEMMAANTEQFVIEGVVETIKPIKLDKRKSVGVFIPEDQTFNGKILPGSGQAIAEKTKSQVTPYFDTIKLTNQLGEADYTIIPTVIRWQDYNPMSGLLDIMTIEYDIVHSKSKTLLARFLISDQEKIFTWEKFFSLFPKNNSPDVLIAEPLAKKLKLYLDVN